MMKKRIDKISSLKGFIAVSAVFAGYILFSEAALNIFGTRNVMNDFEYYASKTFTEEEWDDAEKFRRDIISIGQRGVLIKDSIVYRYKSAKSETVNFNSLGFRGKEIHPRVEGEIRIAMFGTSRTWGNYLPDDKTIPAVIEKILSEKLPGIPITVFNMGVEGSDLQRGVETAKMFHEQLDIDIAVFKFGLSDMNYAYLHGNIEWQPFLSDSPMNDETFDRVVRLMFPKGWLKSRKIYNLIIHSAKGELAGIIYKTHADAEKKYKDIPEFQAKTAQGFHDLFFNRIERTAKYFKEKEISTILFFPHVPQTKEPLSDLEKEMTYYYELIVPGYNKFIKLCTENVLKTMDQRKEKSFEFVDHSNIFDKDSTTVFFDGMHITPGGSNKIAAGISEILLSFIQKNGLDKEKKPNK